MKFWMDKANETIIISATDKKTQEEGVSLAKYFA